MSGVQNISVVFLKFVFSYFFLFIESVAVWAAHATMSPAEMEIEIIR